MVAVLMCAAFAEELVYSKAKDVGALVGDSMDNAELTLIVILNVAIEFDDLIEC